MFNKSVDVWNVVFYDETALLNKLYFLGIDVYCFDKIDNYKYSFEAARKNRKIIKKFFKDCKIVSSRGFLNCVEFIVLRTTFICILIASLCLHNVSKRIWRIDISGDYKEIDSILLSSSFEG